MGDGNGSSEFSQQDLRSKLHVLERENNQLEDLVWQKREELQDIDNKVVLVQEELQHRQTEWGAEKEDVVAEEVMNDVMDDVVTHLLQAVSTRDSSKLETRSHFRGENEAKLQQIIKTLKYAAFNMAEEKADSNKKISVFHIDMDGTQHRESSCSICVTPELRLTELSALAMRYFRLDPHDPKLSHTIVDEAGTTWPGNALVLRDIYPNLDQSTGEPRLYVETTERVEFVNLQLKIHQYTEQADSANGMVPPILGLHAIKRAEREARRKKEEAEGKQRRPDDGGAAGSGGKNSFYIDPVLKTRARCILDFVLLIFLMVVMGAHLYYDNVSVEYDISNEILSVVETNFLGTNGGLTAFPNMTSWEEFAHFIFNPIRIWVEESTLEGSPVVIAMPIRLRQNRVAQFEFGQSQCPHLFINLNEDRCFPAFEQDTNAESFFEGAPNSETLQALVDSDSSVSDAFTYQTTDWNTLYSWHFPPAGSADIAPVFSYPSAGYIIDLPLYRTSSGRPVVNFTMLNTLRDFEARTNITWYDKQTKYVDCTITFYNANYGVWVVAEFFMNLNQHGVFSPSYQGNALADLEHSTYVTLMALDVLAMAIVVYMFLILGLYLRETYRLFERKVQANKEKDRRRKISESVGAKMSTLDEELETRVPFIQVIGVFLLRFWTLLDIFIIVMTLLTVSYAIIPRASERYQYITLPEEGQFVTMSHLATYTTISRICAAHVLGAGLIKFFKYIKTRNPRLLLEIGTLWYSAFKVFYIFMLYILALITFSVASYIFYSQETGHGATYLESFLHFQRFYFSAELPYLASGGTIFSYIFLILYFFCVYFVLLRFIVGACYQGRMAVSTEIMKAETEKSRSSETVQYAKDYFTKLYSDSKIGKPIY